MDKNYNEEFTKLNNNHQLSQINSEGKNISKNDSGYESFNDDLLTFEELKNNLSYNNINNLEQNNSYDLNETWNKEYIINILNNKEYSNQKKVDEFNKIMYKLKYNDRILILNEYKNIFDNDENIKIYPAVTLRQKKKLKEVFISLINEIINFTEDDNIINEFHSIHYIQTQSSNIPFIEGSEEFIFANLINDLYDTFIIKSDYPKSKINKESELVSNILDQKLPMTKINPINIFQNEGEIYKESKVTKMVIEDEKTESNDINFNYNKFSQKRDLLEPILKIYISDEFQSKYEEFLENYLELNKDKRVKYIYEIILESLFYYCLFFNERKKNKLLSDYADIFYESLNTKIIVLRKNKNLIKIKENKENDFIDIKLNKNIKNKDYLVSIEEEEFSINFFDYKLKELIAELLRINEVQKNEKKLFIKNTLNNHQYWTIQKHIKINSPYNNNDLKNLFNNEIDILLKNKVLEKVFKEINIFQDYNYPLYEEKFLEQIHNSLVFIKLPTKTLLGLTLKKMGIIIINKGRYFDIINDQIDSNSKYILKLAEYAFYRISIFHEINFHYFLVIFYSNKKIDFLLTQEKVFKNEKKVNMLLDFGDKGEIILFGTKISFLYIKAIIDIITLDSWKKHQNDELNIIRDAFLELNKEVEITDIKIENLIKLNKFTEHLFNIIEKEKNIYPFDVNIGVGKIFSSGKILNLDPDKIEFNCDFGRILQRGICLNACRYLYK